MLPPRPHSAGPVRRKRTATATATAPCWRTKTVTRAKINAGLLDYVDVHLSHVAQMVAEGLFGPLTAAVAGRGPWTLRG